MGRHRPARLDFIAPLDRVECRSPTVRAFYGDRRRCPPLTIVPICIPVRNEAARLPSLFAALERLVAQDVTVVVCLLLDRCTDDSAAIAEDYRRTSSHRVMIETAAGPVGNAGTARAQAMAMGIAAPGEAPGVLLTTDADSCPAPDWLQHMTVALQAADVVAGRIVRSNHVGASVLLDRIEAYYDTLFALRRRLDPVPWEASATHHYTGGANMGLRADAYRALGGFRPMASGEDAQMVDDAARSGWRVRRDAACVVTTSDRRHGRAAGGLALALQRCDEGDAASTFVSDPAGAAWQYRLHALARAMFANRDWRSVGDAIGLTSDHVLGVARDCPNAEAFAMRIVPAPAACFRELSLPEAEAELARLTDARVAA
ncbi:glycosyltransferase family 2 protein [Sphingomonas sp. RS2018]